VNKDFRNFSVHSLTCTRGHDFANLRTRSRERRGVICEVDVEKEDHKCRMP